MTKEQEQGVHNEGVILKKLFPDLTGYVRFDMCKAKMKAEGTVCYTNIKVKP